MNINKLNLPLRPTQHVENFLVTSILDGTYPIGASLPNERLLSEQLGVTRPTLRETLQRLENEGWVKIRHGKPTVVNNYWREGGLSLLGTLAKYAAYLPNGFITQLLEVRLTLLPSVARFAAEHHPNVILDHLEAAKTLPDEAVPYATFDWNLQIRMARHSNNPIFPLILNDFASIFTTMAMRYFSQQMSREASREYYLRLSRAIGNGGAAVEKIVKAAMAQSIIIWKQIRSGEGGKS
jgi:GntR family negative regulator for fad regulon and positive regulator of fabA